MRYFAEIDEMQIVTRIIVSEPEFIQSGAVGNAANWVETFEDGTRKQFATIGGTYDSSNDVFIGRCKFPSWTLNDTFDWEPPVAHPDTSDGRYLWHEAKQKWTIPEDE